MGKIFDLLDVEKEDIMLALSEGQSTLDISKRLSRDHRTIKSFLKKGLNARKRKNKILFNNVSSRQVSQIRRQVAKTPLCTSKVIFDEACVPNIPKTTRCRILQKVASVKKSKARPPLSKINKEKRVKWASDYMKTDFSNVIFSDECRASLDGPDGWASGWVLLNSQTPTRIRRQQGGGGVMFWAGMIDNEIIGPFRFNHGTKITSDVYCNFLEEHLIKWHKSKSLTLRRKMIFMHDNAKSHSAKHTTEFLAKNTFKDNKLMIWPPCSPDLNPIENYWSNLKQHIYQAGKQFSNNNELWEAILVAAYNIPSSIIKNLTKSVDKRLITLLKKNGGYVSC